MGVVSKKRMLPRTTRSSSRMWITLDALTHDDTVVNT
jgi:hypothetical protein